MNHAIRLITIDTNEKCKRVVCTAPTIFVPLCLVYHFSHVSHVCVKKSYVKISFLVCYKENFGNVTIVVEEMPPIKVAIEFK